MSELCARDGCERSAAPRDEYCSALCCRIAHGVEAAWTDEQKRENQNRKRRVATLRKKYGSHVEFTNPDASAHTLPGSAGTARKGSKSTRGWY